MYSRRLVVHHVQVCTSICSFFLFSMFYKLWPYYLNPVYVAELCICTKNNLRSSSPKRVQGWSLNGSYDDRLQKVFFLFLFFLFLFKLQYLKSIVGRQKHTASVCIRVPVALWFPTWWVAAETVQRGTNGEKTGANPGVKVSVRT